MLASVGVYHITFFYIFPYNDVIYPLEEYYIMQLVLFSSVGSLC